MTRLRSLLAAITATTAALTWTVLSFSIAGPSSCTAFGPTVPSSSQMGRPSALFHAKPRRNPHPAGVRRGVASPIVTATAATRRHPFFDDDRGDDATAKEDEPTRQRQRQRRLAQITLSERLRQRRVSQDKLPYLFLLCLQFLPLLPRSDRLVSVLYFFGLAVATVYLGGRQEVLAPPERVSRENALYAPVAASAAIGGLYVLLKSGVDPTAVYAVAV
eukprot:CAMPEP_0171343084 /NCGR_PEP_ID=MMETSP0878-20121228/16215_1 /TAXON_ID=67004 /ORGANISM="Thalassiosira weissflogii, Strain CCMP1336" /LENGTH=217 /DNA_ID=CAMNT_0011845943 /DNA_START=31 /DNA_END=680 /DNA_ORIENTATION=+